jgi:ClpP class serine protease
VAVARSRTPAELDPIAGGRVWTGRQALGNGLVDELGGFERALAEARRLAGLGEDAALREARAGREAAPLPTGAAAFDHALAAVSSLNRARTWYLWPWS